MSGVYLWMAILVFDLGMRERAKSDRFLEAMSFGAAVVFFVLFLREFFA